jgi:hypothetical protein
MKKWKLLVAVLVGVILLFLLPMLDKVPPPSDTAGRMFVLKRRILRFASKNNRLPPTLGNLPELEGKRNTSKDRWGCEIRYEVKNGRIRLTSYGKDCDPGGSGDDQDMVGEFIFKRSNGEWSNELDRWEVNPLDPFYIK